MNDRHKKRAGQVLVAIAAGLFLLSTPCLFGGVLGVLGILADVGPKENQQIGHQAFRIAMYPLGIGMVMLLAGLLLLRSREE
ncbi:MAG: hypothetical protein SFZ23_07895 [Planctomycetota bacterium]|nr:hypothetical protein [Planctomycetota bacterium]